MEMSASAVLRLAEAARPAPLCRAGTRTVREFRWRACNHCVRERVPLDHKLPWLAKTPEARIFLLSPAGDWSQSLLTWAKFVMLTSYFAWSNDRALGKPAQGLQAITGEVQC